MQIKNGRKMMHFKRKSETQIKSKEQKLNITLKSNEKQKTTKKQHFNNNTFTTNKRKLQLRLQNTNKLTNFYPFYKNKYQNKVKTLDKNIRKFPYNNGKNLKNKQETLTILNQTSPEYKLAQRLQLLVKAADIVSSRENPKLRYIIAKALKENIPWSSIESILQECFGQKKIDKNFYLLQLSFHKKVSLLLSVRATSIILFKKSLRSIMKKFKSCYANVLEHFNYNCKVEALASFKTALKFTSFERQLSQDAMEIQAEAVEIMDYETGGVKFQCHPLQLPKMVEKLEKRNYKILFTDYGFQALDRVALVGKERGEYGEFLNYLLEFKEIEQYYDNFFVEELEKTEEMDKIKMQQL
ncbi:uncharacterized protein LOC119601144 [Lucilia sericata]|uniref:uncharacterized protein LOC119601144 n=1 Tax=Lucilia sericata TaxID=13632 RepID=UPI0018A80DE3|nr:uncharacterized protein LOC119601144 [Lucilia sericata]